MIIKKPYIQIVRTGDPSKAFCFYSWDLIARNGTKIAESSSHWGTVKSCRASAHRAAVTLSLEVRNEK